jgi:hypothetical protein
MVRLAVIAFLAQLALLVGISLTPAAPEASADDARASALQWVGTQVADAPRRDGDVWEVDVRRPDGSLVEVTLDDDLQLRELDEELDAGGVRTAADEVVGELRERVLAVAFDAVGPGKVRSVEREGDESFEVDIEHAGRVLEVELGRDLRVISVDEENWHDE